MPLTLPRAAPALHDIYDPDDVGPPDAEELEPMKYTLVPSPSPEPDAPPPPASPDSSPGPDERSGLPRSPSRPSRGDAVLIAFMAGGKYHDVARDAGETPLAAEGEEAGDVPGPAAPPGRAIGGAPAVEERRPQRGGLDWATMAAMQTLAADALRQAARRSPRPAPDGAPPRSPQPRTERAGAGAREGQVATAVPAIPSRAGDGPASAAQMAPDGIPDLGASPVGELPPIRPSPRATLSHGAAHGQITLPSISAQLGHFEQFADAGEPVYATSPPGRPPQRFAVAPCHGSSPQSPSDVFRALPSPSKNHFYPTYTKSHRRSSHGHDGFPHYPSPTEYPGGSSSSTETPGSGTDGSGPSPATVGIDRMSIDGITNPQIGGFQCTHPGCTAPPFQTQVMPRSRVAGRLEI